MKRPSPLQLNPLASVVFLLFLLLCPSSQLMLEPCRRAPSFLASHPHPASPSLPPPSPPSSPLRRQLLSLAPLGLPIPALAARPKQPAPEDTISSAPDVLPAASSLNLTAPVSVKYSAISSEECLLSLLPLSSSATFQSLRESLTNLNSMLPPPSLPSLPSPPSLPSTAPPSSSSSPSASWRAAERLAYTALKFLDKTRSSLIPPPSPSLSTLATILRYERSEQSLSTLRTSLMQLIGALDSRSLRSSAAAQKQALLALADVGELMVPEFPYNVPSQGREYETLPRLLGRAKVTFTVRRPSPASGRRNPALDRFVEQAFPELTELVSTFSIGRELDRYELVGNVSIVADGFTAPITAGNFVDLAQRGFYNNLPIKTRAVESTSLPILGSFNDGFVDPFTASPRLLPLEISRIDPFTREIKPVYGKEANEREQERPPLVGGKRPVVDFSIPGLVAMHHPKNNVNGASAEFFILNGDEREALSGSLAGSFAPFGYVVDGYEITQSLRAGDVITDVRVDEWGAALLKQPKETSFKAFAIRDVVDDLSGVAEDLIEDIIVVEEDMEKTR